MHPKFEVRGLSAARARQHAEVAQQLEKRQVANASPSASVPFKLDGPLTVTEVNIVFQTGTPPPAQPSPSPSASAGPSRPASTSSATVTPTTPSPSPVVAPSPSASAVTGSDNQTPGVSGSLASKSGGLSGGAIAGVVSVLLLLFLGIVLFFVRKRFINQRERKRGNWVPSFPFSSPAKATGGIVISSPVPGSMEKNPYKPPMIASPMTSYNNELVANTPVTGAAPPTVPSASVAMAVIRCTFIPSMPDELNITTGEMVRVLGEYDDGWALVANARGEQGMVPSECLARGSRTSLLLADNTLRAPEGLGKREAQRLSSLSVMSGISRR